jgi:hypothetical protein
MEVLGGKHARAEDDDRSGDDPHCRPGPSPAEHGKPQDNACRGSRAPRCLVCLVRQFVEEVSADDLGQTPFEAAQSLEVGLHQALMRFVS